MICDRSAAVILAAAVILGTLGSCTGQKQVRSSNSLAPQVKEMRHKVIRVAHRGGAGLAPENTLAAFRIGLEHRADALELDVHLSRDGHLIVIHDASVARTTNSAGEVGELTLAELRKLDAAARYFGPPVGRQHVPTLEEVVELAKGRASLQIEIKLRSDGLRYSEIERHVVDILKRYDMIDQAIILSFDFDSLQTVNALEPRLATCALISRRYMQQVGNRGPAAVAEEMAALGVDFVGVEKTWLTAPLYRELCRRHLGVGVWTVDEEEQIRHFAEMGVDFITSNRPDLLWEVLGRRGHPKRS